MKADTLPPRRWYALTLDEAATAQGIPLAVTRANHLYVRMDKPKIEGGAFRVRRISVHEWAARVGPSADNRKCLSLVVGEFWSQASYETISGDTMEGSSGTNYYPAECCYLTWDEARGGWPMVGDTLVADVPEGCLRTTILALLNSDDHGGAPMVRVTGDRLLPVGCLVRREVYDERRE